MQNWTDRLPAVVIFSALGVISYFLYFWQWNYNSDTALVGMAARRLLSHGELPIFVGEVGYQGLLVDVPLAAGLFALLGQSPVVLDLVPCLFYVLLLVAFFRVLRVSFDPSFAWLTLLFLIWSPPQWYGLVLRPVPNYPETYFFGMVLILIYVHAAKKTFFEKRGSKELVTEALGFGGLAGFAFYLYGQIVYFFLAIALHASLFYFRDQFLRRGSLRRALFPKSFLPIGAILQILPALSVEPIRIGHNKLEAVNLLFLTGLLFGAMHLRRILYAYGRDFMRYRVPALVGVLAFLAGYFPKVYYNLILGLPSEPRLMMGGSWNDIFLRLGLIWQSLEECYRFTESSAIPLVLPIVVIGCLLCFLFAQGKLVSKFVHGSLPMHAFTEISPVFAIFWGTLFPILFSSMFGSLSSHRYLFALYLPIATALAFVSWKLTTKRPMALALVLCFFLACAWNLRRAQNEVRSIEGMQSLADQLIQQGLTTGYADYWLANSLNFLEPRLKLEPLYGNYFHYFREDVNGASRIVLLDAQSHVDFSHTGYALIGKNRYRIVEQKKMDERAVFTLESAPN